MLEPRNTCFWYKIIIVICHLSDQQNQQLKWATLPTKVITVKRAFQLHVGNFVSSSSSNWNQVHEDKNMWYHAWKIIMFIELKWIFTKDYLNHYRIMWHYYNIPTYVLITLALIWIHINPIIVYVCQQVPRSLSFFQVKAVALI